jgi:hypothetical protein
MMYGNDMLDAQGRVKVNEKHHEIVMLDKILSWSTIPHLTEQRFDGYQINYPAELIGYGRKYTIRQHSLTEGNKKALVEVWDNETDEIKTMTVLQAYAKILAHQIKCERG